MDTIARGPAILIHLHYMLADFLHAKEALCYNIVRKLVRQAFFGKQSMQKQQTTCSLYYRHGDHFNAAAQQINKMLMGPPVRIKKYGSTEMQKLNAPAAFVLVRLLLGVFLKIKGTHNRFRKGQQLPRAHFDEDRNVV